MRRCVDVTSEGTAPPNSSVPLLPLLHLENNINKRDAWGDLPEGEAKISGSIIAVFLFLFFVSWY